MARDTEEQERPSEWLRALREGRKTYSWLLDDSGGPTVAAYRLARARGRTGVLANSVPTVAELWIALLDIAQRCGLSVKLPSRLMLVEECEAHELPLIAPLARRAA